MPSDRSMELKRERDGTYSAGSVWLGKQVQPGIFLEPVEEGRHQVRGLNKSNEPVRLGEILGGNRRYSVFSNTGTLIAIERSLISAVEHLEPAEPAEPCSVTRTSGNGAKTSLRPARPKQANRHAAAFA